MANESSFTGEVIFFHKRLSNTPENVRKFIKILDVFLELTNTYYGGFQEVTTDDMEFNEQADYVESISYYFFSCGRWTYENSFNYINKLCKEGFERELNNIKENFPDCYNDISFYDVIGLGFQVTGTDYEPACQVLYEFDAESEIIGIKKNDETEYEVRINSCEDIPFTAENVNEVTPKEYNAKNINEFEANLIYGDLFTVYGIDVFFHTMMKDYREYDSEFNLVIKKYAPTLVSLYENNLLGNYLLNDIQEDLCSIILKVIQEEYTKNNSPIDGIINLEDIDFLMIEDKDDKKLVLNYDNADWYTIFQNIEKSIKKYIGGRGLKICQITS